VHALHGSTVQSSVPAERDIRGPPRAVAVLAKQHHAPEITAPVARTRLDEVDATRRREAGGVPAVPPNLTCSDATTRSKVANESASHIDDAQGLERGGVTARTQQAGAGARIRHHDEPQSALHATVRRREADSKGSVTSKSTA